MTDRREYLSINSQLQSKHKTVIAEIIQCERERKRNEHEKQIRKFVFHSDVVVARLRRSFMILISPILEKHLLLARHVGLVEIAPPASFVPTSKRNGEVKCLET